MLALGFATFAFALWTDWVALGAGATVASLVLGSTVLYGRLRSRRRLSTDASREEDLPWEELLKLLEQRSRDRQAAGKPPEQPTEQELGQLLARLPSVPNARPLELPEDREFKLLCIDERRSGRRRWGNPTEVHLLSPFWDNHVHGLVVNRSTDGIGIFADKEVPPVTMVQIRAVEAPSSVPAVWAEVRHCLKAGRGFILGCEFIEELPWNLRVWFG